MRISFGTIPGNLNTTVGYGNAGFNMVLSLQALGHKVPFLDPDCPVEIFFSQPEWYEFSNSDAYHIGYTPWESTELPAHWAARMNECDEVWTPSPLIAEWYQQAGVTSRVHVYQHGLDKLWRPKKRKLNGVIKFMHMGEPAPRKGGQMAVEAFRAAFGDNGDVQLIIKAHDINTIRVRDSGRFGPPQDIYKNVKLIKREMPQEELLNLYYSVDVVVYPSWGEGFGLIPMQALGTGMVTVCTEAWAPYKDFILPECRLGSKLVQSPWPQMHPGRMFEPDFEQLVYIYRYIYEHIEDLNSAAFKKSFELHEAYDWKKITECAFRHIIDRFSD